MIFQVAPMCTSSGTSSRKRTDSGCIDCEKQLMEYLNNVSISTSDELHEEWETIRNSEIILANQMIRIRIRVYEEDTDDSIMNDSVGDISPPTLIDVIDLTKESPSGSVRSSRSRQRNTEDVSANQSVTGSSDRRRRRPLSPIVLGNTEDPQTRNPKKKRIISPATTSNEVLTLDDTIKEDDKAYYTVDSDDRKPIPLTCPICFELLTSNLKPITTRCGHLFCTECLESFVRISKKCPTCKTAITLKSSTRVYI